MAGYTRQSTASIINGENITAPPLTAEFNQLAAAFNLSSGHSHDGTTGNAPKIELSTSVSGFLPAINGGLGGRNNFAATRVPGVGDDTADGYVVGSSWYFVNDDRYFVCVYAASGAAVWLENRFIDTNGDFRPHANNTNDLGSTTKRWRDLFVSRNTDIDGTLNVAGTTHLGGAVTIAANANFTTGTTTINSIDVASGALDSTTIGITNAAAGVFTTLEAATLTAATADINGGSVDGATVGANSHSTGKFTTLQSTGLATLNSVNIDGGAVDGTVIGANSAASGNFTTISTTGQATLASVDINGGAVDGATIGATTASSGAFTTVTASGGITGALTGNVTGNTSGTHTGPVTGAITGNLTGNVTSSGTSTFNNVTIDGTLNMNAGTSATITNLSAPTNDNDAARKIDVDNAVSNLVDSAPGALDTLNELAAALGDDPDFATTITNSIATKLPLAGGTMTGAIAMSTNKITGVGDPTAAQDVSSKAYVDQQDALQVNKSGDSMSGNLAMGSNNITGLATPTANDHAVNKSYADNILGSSTAAATSAANAATSESNAATSATNASNSAASALTSKNAAATSLATFQNQYLGAQGSAPTQDPDGSALDVGDLYFDTTAGAMKVYSANGWTNAGSSVNGTTNRYSYTATAGQTVFAATYDAGYVDVFLNGVKQVIGSTKDVTATTGTSIVFNSATSVNDVVDIIGYGTFVLADHLTQTQSDARYVEVAGDTMTGNLSFGDNKKAIFGAGSDLQIYHDGSHSIIKDAGAGYLKLGLSDQGTAIQNTAGTNLLVTDATDVSLRHNGSEKLTTTSTGIDVTGTVTSDGLTVDGTAGISVTSGDNLTLTKSTGAYLVFHDGTQKRAGINSLNTVDGMAFTTGTNTERMRLDNLGTLAVGTTHTNNWATFDGRVRVGARGVLATTTASTQIGHNWYYDGGGSSGYKYIDTDYASRMIQANGYVSWELAGSGSQDAEITFDEKMRLDASGKLLVGGTSQADSTSVTLNPQGYIYAKSSHQQAGIFDRDNSPGDILIFRSNSAPIGSIGVNGGRPYLTNPTYGGLRVDDYRVNPATTSGANWDNALDLGSGGTRWKDLYLSGGVYLGGTVAANKLDDYESGTWSPSIRATTTDPTVTYATRLGAYVIIGNTVYISFYIYCSSGNVTGGVGNIQIGNLPVAIQPNGGYSNFGLPFIPAGYVHTGVSAQNAQNNNTMRWQANANPSTKINLYASNSSSHGSGAWELSGSGTFPIA